MNITLARKSLNETVAETVLRHGTGGLNIDASRVRYASEGNKTPVVGKGSGGLNPGCGANFPHHKTNWGQWKVNDSGRFPANFIHNGSREVLEVFPKEAGASAPVLGTEGSTPAPNGIYGQFERTQGVFHNDSGSAARFFKEIP